jgi:hypothetical protein
MSGNMSFPALWEVSMQYARFLSLALAATLVFAMSPADAKSGIPRPHSFGPNADGQRWTVTFHPGGRITAKSTCKASEGSECVMLGEGTWVRKSGVTCYTIATWNGVAYGNPESCFKG